MLSHVILSSRYVIHTCENTLWCHFRFVTIFNSTKYFVCVNNSKNECRSLLIKNVHSILISISKDHVSITCDSSSPWSWLLRRIGDSVISFFLQSMPRPLIVSSVVWFPSLSVISQFLFSCEADHRKLYTNRLRTRSCFWTSFWRAYFWSFRELWIWLVIAL